MRRIWIGSVSGVPSKGKENGERVPSWENIDILYNIGGGEEILQIANRDVGNVRGNGLGCERNR